jgi:hypothetical protein
VTLKKSNAARPPSTTAGVSGMPDTLPWNTLAVPARSRPPGALPLAPTTRSLDPSPLTSPALDSELPNCSPGAPPRTTRAAIIGRPDALPRKTLTVPALVVPPGLPNTAVTATSLNPSPLTSPAVATV